MFKRNLLQISKICRYYSSSRIENWQSGSFLDIGTRTIFNEEHDLLRTSTRKFFQEQVQPFHSEWEKAGQVSRELWTKAGEHGILGLETKVEHHGLGADFLSSAIVIEEQAYVNATGPGFAMHSNIVMPYISKYGTKEQIDKYLPKMTSGEMIGALAMTEPSAGSDLQGIRTRAVKDGKEWVLNGSKVFISNGYMADLAIVVAITHPQAKSPAHGISLFLVEAGAPGYQKGKKLNKMGLKAQDTAELFFNDCRIPEANLLGEVNKGFYYLMEQLPQERLIIGIICMASCEWMFEETRTYLKERKAFGSTLSEIKVLQHRLAEIKSDIAVGRAYLDSCLQIHNTKGLDSSSASISKYWASELMNRVAYQCVQMHGGWGYMWEYPISKAYVDARVQTIYGGSNEIMKELIARQIVK